MYLGKSKFRVVRATHFDDPYMPGNAFSITPTLQYSSNPLVLIQDPFRMDQSRALWTRILYSLPSVPKTSLTTRGCQAGFWIAEWACLEFG